MLSSFGLVSDSMTSIFVFFPCEFSSIVLLGRNFCEALLHLCVNFIRFTDYQIIKSVPQTAANDAKTSSTARKTRQTKLRSSAVLNECKSLIG